MEGMPIAFRLAKYDRNRASEFVERPVGLATSSHGGKYVDRRKGPPDEIPHVRLIRCVVIVRTEDAGRVVVLLEQMGAEVHQRKVEVARKDREALHRETTKQSQPLPPG